MLSDNTSYRVCEILTSSDSSPLINFASGLSAILDVGFIWIQSYSFLVRLETWRWRLIWCYLALSRARYSVLSHDYDVNISVCFAEPSRALFFWREEKKHRYHEENNEIAHCVSITAFVDESCTICETRR